MGHVLWTGAERFSEKIESRFIAVERTDELIKELQGLEDATTLAWSGERGAVFSGSWWARRGYFESKMECFQDAFDSTSYETEVWYYRGESKEDPAIELHPLLPDMNVHKIPQAVELRTVGELRSFLLGANRSERLLKTDQNFELGGSLTARVYLWFYSDAEKACVML